MSRFRASVPLKILAVCLASFFLLLLLGLTVIWGSMIIVGYVPGKDWEVASRFPSQLHHLIDSADALYASGLAPQSSDADLDILINQEDSSLTLYERQALAQSRLDTLDEDRYTLNYYSNQYLILDASRNVISGNDQSAELDSTYAAAFPLQGWKDSYDYKFSFDTKVLERKDGKSWTLSNFDTSNLSFPAGSTLYVQLSPGSYGVLNQTLSRNLANLLQGNELVFILLLVGILISLIILYVFLFQSCGYKRRADGSLPERGEISLNFTDYIYQEVYIPACLGVMLLFFAIAALLSADSINTISSTLGQLPSYSAFSTLAWLVTPPFASCLAGLLVFHSLILSEARRIKAHLFWRSSLIGRLFGLINRLLQSLPRNLALGISFILYYLLAIPLFFYLWNRLYSISTLFLIFVLLEGLPFVFFLYLVYIRRSLYVLNNMIADMSQGGFSATPRLTGVKLLPSVNRAVRNLENLGQSARRAVEAQVNSERLKTELITNVSHDLKTPLTSIISYVDLLKKEQPGSAASQEYLKVLEQKSERLRRLIDDLVEASKAATGNLTLNTTEIDLTEFLRQVHGEFIEKFTVNHLELILRLPEQVSSVLLQTDGHYLWRILENLLENARKYSLSGSRVYLDLLCLNDGLKIRIRNISAAPIDLSTEELMERFIRGDSARSSEGSGLGLSIAQSLAEVLGGHFELDVHDDIFTAAVYFPASLEQPEGLSTEAVSPLTPDQFAADPETNQQPPALPLDQENGETVTPVVTPAPDNPDSQE
ncbi:HAMP domain-containing histidine kinase [Oscillospiraceae bacterium HV4-5-C5C]|nr:HAMP domain-containing histidine kinase [Oscillospiraceae bacterium HV4-5-C5C]